MSDQVLNDSTANPELPSDIDLIEVLTVIAEGKRIIVISLIFSILLGALVYLLWPKKYTATASLLPPQAEGFSSAALLGQLGGLIGSAAGGALGLKDSSDMYVGILKSNTIADKLIRKFSLMTVYNEDTLVDTRKRLADKTAIEVSREGLIVIAVEDDTPERAAELSNAYIEELEILSKTLAISEAGKRRAYYERYLETVKKSLSEAEIALKKAQETSGLILIEGQGQVIMEGVAALQAQIAAKEVEIASLRSFGTENNPLVIRAQQEMTRLRALLTDTEKRNVNREGDVFVSTSKLPDAALQYLRRFRDVKYYEAVFEVVSKHFELAKIEEGKNNVSIQQVDKALPPDKSSWPKAIILMPLFVILGTLLAIAYVISRHLYLRAITQAGFGQRLMYLLRHVRAW